MPLNHSADGQLAFPLGVPFESLAVGFQYPYTVPSMHVGGDRRNMVRVLIGDPFGDV